MAVAIVYEFALGSPRQIEITQEHVARIEATIVVPLARFTITLLAPVVVALADILVPVADDGRMWTTSERQPLVLAIVNAVVSLARVTIARIEVA